MNCSRILKWNVGVIIFLRENHFLPNDVRSPVPGDKSYLEFFFYNLIFYLPSHGSIKSYSADFLVDFVLHRSVSTSFGSVICKEKSFKNPKVAKFLPNLLWRSIIVLKISEKEKKLFWFGRSIPTRG